MKDRDTTPREACEATPDQSTVAPRKPYRPPHLTRFGDVRDVTLGPSVGIGESGNPLVFKA